MIYKTVNRVQPQTCDGCLCRIEAGKMTHYSLFDYRYGHLCKECTDFLIDHEKDYPLWMPGDIGMLRKELLPDQAPCLRRHFDRPSKVRKFEVEGVW